MTKSIETFRGTVYPWTMDQMGHMNVQFYTARFDEASWQFFAALGLSSGYMREHRRGLAALEQHTQYKQEVLPGALLHIRTELLEMKRKTIRFRHRMIDSETGAEVANTELVAAYLDKDLRKATEFPEMVLRKGEALLRQETAANADRDGASNGLPR